ncbi:MAG: twin-arginine translocase subunit TatC [Nocardioides sp.]
MALSDHLRELRARILKAFLVIAVGFGVAVVFHQQVFDLFWDPYLAAQEQLPSGSTIGTTSGAGAGLMLWIKICSLAAVVGTSPLWLYQLWAFVLPGLHRSERTWTYVFLAIAGPLFIGGATIAYLTLPKALEVLIGFNPEGVTNLNDFGQYITFVTRTVLGFGIAFEIPVFVVLLNFAGIVSGKSLGAHRPWIVIGTFIFAAIITPSTDPFTMCFMAVPMVVLFAVSEVIARLNDRRRAARGINAGLSSDEASRI